MVKQCGKRDHLMARTNKTQQYAILWLNSTGKDYENIAKELGLELKQIQRVLEKSINVNQQSSVQTTSETVKQPTSKDLMTYFCKEK